MSKQIEESRRRARIALEAYKQAGGIEPEWEYMVRDLISDCLHVLHETMYISQVEEEHMMAIGNFLAEIEENSDEN